MCQMEEKGKGEGTGAVVSFFPSLKRVKLETVSSFGASVCSFSSLT